MIAVFITTFMIAAIISLCVNELEQQRFWAAKQGLANGEVKPIIYVFVILAVIVIIAGYLIINNVMSVSVSKDIRLYGLLKAVGMTQKQIRKMIFRQIRRLCAVNLS